MLQNARPFSWSSGLFSLAKWVSLVVAILALVAAIIFALSSLANRGNFHVPRFDSAARAALLGNLPTNQASVAQQKVNLKLSQEYGREIISIISKYNISVTNEQQVINRLAALPKDYRSAFVSGWEDYLGNGIDYAKKEGVFQAVATSNGLFNQQPSTADLLTQQYFGEYSNAINTAESNRGRERIDRIANLGMALFALMIFVVAVIVPILVQVERNTRPLPAISPAAKVAVPEDRKAAFATPVATPIQSDANRCQNCHHEIVMGDAFCGNCGHRLT
ncbi:zinc ribbon domain-containing protein [Candidatus Igneacidithiobacillus taiwanensis]|uniref:zinc ribbon domain-containing protein n=1 Tax=Candidatus Igneacidithiobacillus taiwanensis TaxID=1945924 RepID=UPI00289D2E9A|nr:zinc ribbon domain-containing protein [Candidatus Igneacidithiobacillus taiwanensis]MCE5360978.1 zinc ribbon domain-containing protein [Acidithiobacillus sp.]